MSALPFSSWSLFSFALSKTFSEFSTLLRLCIVPVVLISAAIVLTCNFFGESLGFIGMALGLVGLFAMVPSITGWHRLLILGSADRGNGKIYGWDQREWGYLGSWLILVVICIILGAVIAAVMGVVMTAVLQVGGNQIFALAPFVTLAGSIVSTFLMSLIVARFGLALPASAISEGKGLGQASVLVDGHTLTIAGGVFFAALFSSILQFLVGLATGTFSISGVAADIVQIILFFGFMFTVFVSAGVLSRAYVAVKGNAPSEA